MWPLAKRRNTCLPAESADVHHLAVDDGGTRRRTGPAGWRRATPGRRTPRRDRQPAGRACVPLASGQPSVGSITPVVSYSVSMAIRRICRAPLGECGRQKYLARTRCASSAACIRAPIASDVGVVVQARQPCGLGRPGQRGPHALAPCWRRSARRFPTRRSRRRGSRVGHDGGRRSAGSTAGSRRPSSYDARTVVDRLVTLLAQPADQVALQLEAGMVGPEVDAHGVMIAPTAPRRKPVASVTRRSADPSGCA